MIGGYTAHEDVERAGSGQDFPRDVIAEFEVHEQDLVIRAGAASVLNKAEIIARKEELTSNNVRLPGSFDFTDYPIHGSPSPRLALKEQCAGDEARHCGASEKLMCSCRWQIVKVVDSVHNLQRLQVPQV